MTACPTDGSGWRRARGCPPAPPAEKPAVAEHDVHTTLGAPSGALGGSKGAQSGTESLMSTLLVPVNTLLIGFLRLAFSVPVLVAHTRAE